MKVFSYESNGHRIQFVCDSRKTRNGFAHDAACIIDDDVLGQIEATCNYYNRTWERYTFQTVCKKIAHEQAANCCKRERRRFMEERNYARMTAKRKAEFTEWINENANDDLRLWCDVSALVANFDLMDPPYPEWYGHRPSTFTPSYFA
ncbi:hypothetical protein [Adlercreutzia sp. ZJ242]|uniref:hypothetical protein n=1 Tax=Adlercreutzia sp. ZJ242 TaxID=2709409 RepID=UPI0013EE283D|nr:hypothetical protein [Adlercreutzia sp. ZJ242]